MNKVNTDQFINIISLIISIIFGIFILYFQYKFSTLPITTIEVLKSLSLATIIFLLPDIIADFIKKKNKPEYVPFIIILFTSIGFIVTIPFILLILIAVLLIAYTFFRMIKNKQIILKEIHKHFAILIMIFIISIYIITQVFSLFINPLFIERLASGQASTDTLFHASYANIILHQHIPSTGLHGTDYNHYHYLSHIVFAGLGNLAGIKSFTFYSLSFPIIFIPFFIKAIFQFSNKIIQSYKISISFTTQLFIIMITIIYLFPFLIREVNVYCFESHNLAIAFSLFFLSGFFDIINKNFKQNNKQILSLILLSTIMLIIITLTKSSAGYVFLAMLSYIFLRLFSLKHYALYLFVLLSGILLYVFFSLFNESSMSGWFSVKAYVYNQIHILLLPFILIILVFAKDNFIETPKNIIKNYFNNKKLLFLELSIVSIISVIVPIVILSIGSHLMFFTSFTYTITTIFLVPLILIYTKYFLGNIKIIKKSKQLLILILTVFIFIYNFEGFYKGYARIPKSEIQIKENSKKYLNLVTKLNNLKYDKNTVLYVPKTNTLFWNKWQKRTSSWNEKTPNPYYFIIPALTGMSQLYAINYKGYNNFNFGRYKKIKNPTDFSEVITEAKRLNYKKIIVITDSLNLKTYKISE